MLNVKVATLYSYVSRGLIRAYPGEQHRERTYLRADVERVRARAAARAGHAAVAAGALRWGEPVLDSSITEIRADGPAYRGQLATELAANATFEQVAELLWTGNLGVANLPWAQTLAGPKPPPADDVLAMLMAQVARQNVTRTSVPSSLLSAEAELRECRALIRAMAEWIAAWSGHSVEPVRRAKSVAEALALALGAKSHRAGHWLNQALILCADHELNASSFSARVAASTGAGLYACMLSALAAFSGPAHGYAGARVEALVDEMKSDRSARELLRARAQRGDLPGLLGHRLYPKGDPRGARLLELTRQVRVPGKRLQHMLALVDGAEALGLSPPDLDFGLVALSAALGLERGTSTIIFCVGRVAGWMAHIQEQRISGIMLRPRARYVPVSSEI